MSQQKSLPVRNARRDIPLWSAWRTCGSPFITRQAKGLDIIQALLRSIHRHGLWIQLLICFLSHLFCKWYGVSLQACPWSPEWSDMVPSNYPKTNMEMRISGLATHMADVSAADVIRSQITRHSLVKSKVIYATSYTAPNFVSLAKARFCNVSIKGAQRDRQWSHCKLCMMSEHLDKCLLATE
jgi:hypothetical protein